MISIPFLIEIIPRNYADASISERKKFSKFFSAFPKCILNFEHFKKQDDPHRRCIFQITDSAKSD